MPANEFKIAPDQIFKSAYEALAASSKKLPFKIDCRAGCAHCCRHLMIATFHLSEAKIAIDHAREHFEEEQFSKLEKRIRDNREKIDAADVKTMKDYTALTVPCAFLDGDNCSIYEARPFACRAAVSESEAACKEALVDKILPEDNGAVHKQGTGLHAQRYCLFVSTQLKNGMQASGTAEQNYEWNEALVHVLDGTLPTDSHEAMIQDRMLAIGQSLETTASAAASAGNINVKVTFNS